MLILLDDSAGAAGNFLSPISTLSANAFKTVIDIDTIGSYNTLKATIPHLVTSAKKNPNTGKNPSTGGRIIFISATFHFTGMPLQTHAAVAKAGVDALSASVALEYGPRGVTSNILTPGPSKFFRFNFLVQKANTISFRHRRHVPSRRPVC